MYEEFGAVIDPQSKAVSFKLFMPENCGSAQKSAENPPSRITKVSVVGTFQSPQRHQWDAAHALILEAGEYRNSKTNERLGTLYCGTVEDLKDGYYEYKYCVEFEDGSTRWLTDPCARYGGAKHQNSGFVVGEELEEVEPIAQRLPQQDLVIYELMIDDFTANLLEGGEAPLQAIVRKLDELEELGINAIEFMPWTAWANKTEKHQSEKSDFSWGYDPVQYFALAHKYTLNRFKETEKLVHLKRLVNECHKRGIHVIMDAVFNHADGSTPDKGFPYYWLYQNPDDSPFVGEFEEHDYFQDLDYANQCTFEYIRDSCFYWIDTFKIDGIRFDNTQGYYRQGDKEVGVIRLIAELRDRLAEKGEQNFSLTMEHTWDFATIDAANDADATSSWLDPFRSEMEKYLRERPNGMPQIEPDIMRVLDAGRGYTDGRVPTIYIENHDHRRIACAAGGRGCWHLTQPLAIALFTSPGATLIYNGQEWGVDDDVPDDGEGRVKPRPLDWEARDQDEGPQIQELYRHLIKLRHAHPALHGNNFYPSNWDDRQTHMNEEGFGLDRDRGIVVYHRWGNDAKGHLQRYYVVLNFSPDTQNVSFEIPEDGFWNELLTGTKKKSKDGRLAIEVGSNWGAIYHHTG